MEDYQTWQGILKSLTDYTESRGLLEEFGKISGDLSKRIQFCLENKFIDERLNYWINLLVKSPFPEDVAKDAEKLRELGNKLFGKKDFVKSVVAYSCCFNLADNDNLKSLALANRSAALFHLKMFPDCITDIDQALNLNYPESLRPKVLLRKARSLLETGRREEFEKAIKELEMFNDPKILQEVKMLKNVKVKSTKDNKQESFLPDLLLGENDEVPGMSSALEVRQSIEKGRFVVAGKQVSKGDSLFVERPYAAVVLPDFQETRCNFCVKLLTERYVCLDCGESWFCSAECRTRAKFHKSECGRMSLLNSVGIAHLALRVVLVAGLENLCQDETGKDDYKRVHDLVTHAEEMNKEEIFQYTLTAALLTKLLDSGTTFFTSGVTSELKHKIGGLILRHVTQLVCNAHAITDICDTMDSKRVQGTSQLQQERIATAIYPSASLMNHSCDPTIINSFQGNVLIVRSMKDVESGGEIFNCYGPHFRRMRRSDRISALQSQYNFRCDCPHCSGDTEDFQEYLSSFKCPECSGPLKNPSFNPGLAKVPVQTVECRKCGKLQNYLQQLKSDLEAISLEKQGAEAMVMGDMNSAVTCLKRCVNLRVNALFQGHPDLGRSADRLAQCFATCGLFGECEKYLEISLKCVEEQYGRFSVEFANELQKVTDVLFGVIDGDPASGKAQKRLKKYLEEAASIYSTYYGPWSRDYVEIGQKIEKLQ